MWSSCVGSQVSVVTLQYTLYRSHISRDHEHTVLTFYTCPLLWASVALLRQGDIIIYVLEKNKPKLRSRNSPNQYNWYVELLGFPPIAVRIESLLVSMYHIT